MRKRTFGLFRNERGKGMGMGIGVAFRLERGGGRGKGEGVVGVGEKMAKDKLGFWRWGFFLFFFKDWGMGTRT